MKTNQQRYPVPRPDIRPRDVGTIRPEAIGTLTYDEFRHVQGVGEAPTDRDQAVRTILMRDHIMAAWSGCIMLASILMLVAIICWINALSA